MSHFAELDENNVVVRVLVGDNDMPNEGYDWFIENLGGRWVQTSYNNNFRSRFAGIGFVYDEIKDVFYDPMDLRKAKRVKISIFTEEGLNEIE
jgi:hypothetical protein